MPCKSLPVYDKQVRHWRLSKDLLGCGTTSSVLRATHMKQPTLCAAVKIISRSGLLAKAGADPTALHLADSVIHREVLLMKLGHHERIVRLYDFVATDDLVYIIMEHASQKTLFDLFCASPSYLPRSLVTHVFSQFMHGLAYLHELHIVHRDLKLENVFIFGLDPKMLLCDDLPAYGVLNVKIGDFGLAHIDDPDELSTIFHGSPHYQAPEIWLRVPHRSFPTDIWSAGVVLYALLCRQLPFNIAALKNAAFSLEIFEKVGNQNQSLRPNICSSGQHMPYDPSENLHPAANHLLRKIFAYDPVTRPTARGILGDFFFCELPKPYLQTDIYEDGALVMDPRVNFYDLACLCVPPGRHVPRASFPGSALENAVKDRVEGDTLEREWARRLSTYEKSKDAWEASVTAQITENKRKKYTKSLGRKNKAMVPLVQTEMNLAIPRPKLIASFSFNNLHFKTTPKPKVNLEQPSHNRTFMPPIPQSASSTVSGALQDRREALLRRAYELGFGTEDLCVFADETNVIVRVAREGKWQMGLQEIAQEVKKRAVNDSPSFTGASGQLVGCRSTSPSATPTLVSDYFKGVIVKS